jgi:hypothetical protein
MSRTLILVLALLLPLTPPAALQAQTAPQLTVYKSPTCGCCKKWVQHMAQAGFMVTVNDTPNVGEVKAKHNIPSDLASCHTALVGGYVIEGHVPADVVKKLLDEKPKVAGIAVPGMPMGSPGMEGPTSDHYNVVAFTTTGSQYVFASR